VRLYTASFAVNPRRVKIYLVEKGLADAVEQVKLNMLEGEHRTPEFRTKNPLGKLPVLELDDGRILTESSAITTYLEALHPDPPLWGGTDPWRRAKVLEAERLAELGLLYPAGIAFQHTSPFFAKRMTQSADAADGARKQFAKFVHRFDGILASGQPWLAGDEFSMADISAICAVDFGAAAGCAPPAEDGHFAAWLERVRERPSCQIKKKTSK